jgi:hypothetical protein
LQGTFSEKASLGDSARFGQFRDGGACGLGHGQWYHDHPGWFHSPGTFDNNSANDGDYTGNSWAIYDGKV